MTAVVKSNFVTVDSFLLSMRASLRQALIRKLAHVKSPDQAAWMKAEDYIAGLLNDDQMLTLETTDHAIKIFENCASRALEPNTVLPAGASTDDPLLQCWQCKLRSLSCTRSRQLLLLQLLPALQLPLAKRLECTHTAILPNPRPSSRAPSANSMDRPPSVAGFMPKTSLRRQPR